MRKVQRSDLGRPSVIDPENSAGAEETEANIEEIFAADNSEPRRKPALKFEVYKEREIKIALHAMFHGKCAYCESRYYATTPMDVEHYRPKKEVEKWKDQPKQRGYFWLGASWTNLLPSCVDCNRRREHFDIEEGQDGPVLGKRAIFPLLDPALRWGGPDDDHNEGPLLINPCDDGEEPEAWFRFDVDGFVDAAEDIDDETRKRVEASIEIYGLNRPGLVEERLAVIRLLQHKIALIDRVVEIIDSQPDDTRTRELAEDLLQFALEDLRSFQEASQPYSLMAHHVTEAFLVDFM